MSGVQREGGDAFGGAPINSPLTGGRYGEMLGGPQRLDDSQGQMMAGGGIVTEPTRAILGENEPEMVIPLKPGMAGGNGARMRPSAMGGFGRRYGT